MNKLAKEGIDTFLLNMPFRLAVLNKNAADKIISKYQYDTYYMSGHSLGGVMAIDYEKIDEISSDLFTKKFFKEIVIDGGNHASFADYGKQKGDGEATISVEEQVDRTVEEIINYVGELKKLGVGGV